MAAGLAAILERISNDPSDENLVDRYLALLSEQPDSKEKANLVLQLAQTLIESDPHFALQIAYLVFGYDRSSPDTLDVMADCLAQLGRHGKAEVIRNEKEKIAALKVASKDVKETAASFGSFPDQMSRASILPNFDSDKASIDIRAPGEEHSKLDVAAGFDAAFEISQAGHEVVEKSQIYEPALQIDDLEQLSSIHHQENDAPIALNDITKPPDDELILQGGDSERFSLADGQNVSGEAMAEPIKDNAASVAIKDDEKQLSEKDILGFVFDDIDSEPAEATMLPSTKSKSKKNPATPANLAIPTGFEPEHVVNTKAHEIPPPPLLSSRTQRLSLPSKVLQNTKYFLVCLTSTGSRVYCTKQEISLSKLQSTATQTGGGRPVLP